MTFFKRLFNARPAARSLLVALFFAALSIFISSATAEEPSGEGNDDQTHWAFRTLQHPAIPAAKDRSRVRTPVDSFIQAKLEEQGLSIGKQADRATLLRRLSYDLIGLPPSPEMISEYLRESGAEADDASRQIDRLLASPHYGERWGKYWLDAAGYADSNGYFNADTDRPLAYKYRDYVIRAMNADKPYDQFIREQLAGDEIAAYAAGDEATERVIELLTATHFLRNSQDGTSESDGNPDERTIDRATVLEGTLQITMNSLLGITIQCARCHEHKFEPIEHEEYYRLQSIFYPAFPFFDEAKWVVPRKRIQHVATPAEMARWKTDEKQISEKVAILRNDFASWEKANRPPSDVLLSDTFDNTVSGSTVSDSTGMSAKLSNWTTTVPGDDAPAGQPVIQLNASSPPAAAIVNSTLQIIESGGQGDRWLSTKQVFDWTPDLEGTWIQATFDLVTDKLSPQGKSAERIAFCIALHDFNDNSQTPGGNILVDGNPAGGAAIYIDYPGDDSKVVGSIGKSGYQAGHRYGVRITNSGKGKFVLQQVVDWQVEEKTITLSVADLPDGAFGFEYCCGRSFVVDNVTIETSSDSPEGLEFAKQAKQRREKLSQAIKTEESQRSGKPGSLAPVTDVVFPSPDVFVLEMGLYDSPDEKVQPGGLDILSSGNALFSAKENQATKTSGRRLAFADWITDPKAPSSALLARVMVNRIWQQHFGIGLVATSDNLGQSGAAASHPDLLEYLAAEFVQSGWSNKAIHRLICNSAVFQQASYHRADHHRADHQTAGEVRKSVDAENRLLSRFPVKRLDAEAIRDGMLSAAGELDENFFGPYVPAQRQSDGNITIDPKHSQARRRGVYLQQRRTQVNTLLELFDAPSMANTCSKRTTSTVPLQSLAMLNSEFVRSRARAVANRIMAHAEGDRSRIDYAFLLITGRSADESELATTLQFIEQQRDVYAERDDREQRVWADFCQMLLASNLFLYVE